MASCEGARTQGSMTWCKQPALYVAFRSNADRPGTILFYACLGHANQWQNLGYTIAKLEDMNV